MDETFKFIDLFAGIGGFHQALSNLGGECVFASEIDKYARLTYETNYKETSPNLFNSKNRELLFNEDITKIKPNKIPNFNILCAGFPCQPFSNAGKKEGFQDQARGTLFFNIAQILEEKQPDALFLENVRGLLKHNNGKTFNTIQTILKNELNYKIYHKIVKASDFGLPQHRPRLFIIGFKDPEISFTWPEPIPLNLTMKEIFNAKEVNKEIGYTLRVGGRGSPINDKRNWGYFDSDGNADAIAQKADGDLLLYRTNGTKFINEARNKIGHGWTGIKIASATDDSGRTGLVAQMPDNTLRYYQMTGKSSWVMKIVNTSTIFNRNKLWVVNSLKN